VGALHWRVNPTGTYPVDDNSGFALRRTTNTNGHHTAHFATNDPEKNKKKKNETVSTGGSDQRR